MHNDFYKMIGTLHAASRFLLTRKPDGTRRRGITPADASTMAGKLTGIADNLLTASFEFEVVENDFQKNWDGCKAPLIQAAANLVIFANNNTVTAIIPTAADNSGPILNAEYDARFDMTDPGTGERAQDFIDLFNARLTRASQAMGPNPNPRFRTAKTELTAQLVKLQTDLDSLLIAAGKLADVFREEAHKFSLVQSNLENLLGGQANSQTGIYPWTGLDEQLHALLGFLLKSAQATVGGGPGGTPVASWGSTGTSGSSSSSSSSSGG